MWPNTKRDSSGRRVIGNGPEAQKCGSIWKFKQSKQGSVLYCTISFEYVWGCWKRKHQKCKAGKINFQHVDMATLPKTRTGDNGGTTLINIFIPFSYTILLQIARIPNKYESRQRWNDPYIFEIISQYKRSCERLKSNHKVSESQKL